MNVTPTHVIMGDLALIDLIPLHVFVEMDFMDQLVKERVSYFLFKPRKCWFISLAVCLSVTVLQGHQSRLGKSIKLLLSDASF